MRPDQDRQICTQYSRPKSPKAVCGVAVTRHVSDATGTRRGTFETPFSFETRKNLASNRASIIDHAYAVPHARRGASASLYGTLTAHAPRGARRAATAHPTGAAGAPARRTRRA